MKKHAKILLYTILGNTLLAFGICAFVVPNGFMLGGANGIGLALQHFFPVRLSVVNAVLNGGLFLVGWVFLGKQFAARSLISTIMYPVIMAVFEELPLGTLFNDEKLICALAASACIGMGIGLVIRVGGSTGGMDIPPLILQKFKGIPVGRSMMFFDGLILLAQFLLNGSTEGMLHSLLILVVISMTVDHTVVSGEQKVEIIIISPNYQIIRKQILERLDCGVTMLDIETGYEGLTQKAILSVVYAKKYPEIRDMALMIDPKAFIVASEVKNVNGVGYTIARK